jgi:hypothetical protein
MLFCGRADAEAVHDLCQTIMQVRIDPEALHATCKNHGICGWGLQASGTDKDPRFQPTRIPGQGTRENPLNFLERVGRAQPSPVNSVCFAIKKHLSRKRGS